MTQKTLKYREFPSFFTISPLISYKLWRIEIQNFTLIFKYKKYYWKARRENIASRNFISSKGRQKHPVFLRMTLMCYSTSFCDKRAGIYQLSSGLIQPYILKNWLKFSQFVESVIYSLVFNITYNFFQLGFFYAYWK